MTYPTQSMQQVLYKIKQGDQAAFAEVYNHYRKPALKFCTALLKDEEEAQNLLQEVFIKIWDRRALIKPELNFQSYLFISLRNMVFDHLKKLEKNQLMMQYYLERMEALAEEDKEEKEVKIQRLYAAMSSLSRKREQILRLNVEEGKTYQEIAESMQISKNTVKNQLVKAKQILKQKVDFASL